MPARSQPDLTIDRPLPNTYWVIPGVVSFVDLTEDGELPSYRHLLPKHADYLRSAIADTRVPNNVVQTQELLAAIRAALARERRVYVHCRAGIGRTGLVIGCFLADEESNGKTALKILNRLWRQSERAVIWPKVPQTAEQADYVRLWPKFGKRTAQG